MHGTVAREEQRSVGLHSSPEPTPSSLVVSGAAGTSWPQPPGIGPRHSCVPRVSAAGTCCPCPGLSAMATATPPGPWGLSSGCFPTCSFPPDSCPGHSQEHEHGPLFHSSVLTKPPPPPSASGKTLSDCSETRRQNVRGHHLLPRAYASTVGWGQFGSPSAPIQHGGY